MASIKSTVPSPTAFFGESTPRQALKQVFYDGRRLSAFLKAHGGDPTKYREFLYANRFGSIYDVVSGLTVVVPQATSQESRFSTHPEA